LLWSSRNILFGGIPVILNANGLKLVLKSAPTDFSKNLCGG
jgi:hypothetical protein